VEPGAGECQQRQDENSFFHGIINFWHFKSLSWAIAVRILSTVQKCGGVLGTANTFLYICRNFLLIFLF
jgi:hypothetical protein